MSTDPRRVLPSVSALLEFEGVRSLLTGAPRALVVDAIRDVLADARRDPARADARDAAAWATAIRGALERRQTPSLRPVLNATGVVLHTNLGRAPLAGAAIRAIAHVAAGYSNLEYDIDAGSRGSRYVHCAALLRELTGAEDAIVVNNGASALVLALDTFASGREAIVSRGELVEIGGSFRVPDIMAKSGATLVEVGTTNRTHLDDYRRAITERTGAIVKVHRSNFALEGFVADADASDLAALADECSLPLLHDLGSGLLLSLEAYGLAGEPTAREALNAGASVVTMSGDKLLGGPQAGIVLGARAQIDAMRRNPLARALRVDKMTLAALEATLTLYREPGRALREIPALVMLTTSVGTLRARADAVRARLGEDRCDVVESEASVGGGAYPTARIPSVALALRGDAAQLERKLRLGDPCVVGRVSEGRLLLDLRTIARSDDETLARAILSAHD